MAWLSAHILTLVFAGGLSLFVMVSGFFLVRILIVAMPADYFCRRWQNRSVVAADKPLARVLLFVLKNLAGVALIVVGLVMLVTPGPGLVAVVAGVLLLSFPGKHALERYMVSRPAVRSAIDAVRAKHGRPPLVLPDSASSFSS